MQQFSLLGEDVLQTVRVQLVEQLDHYVAKFAELKVGQSPGHLWDVVWSRIVNRVPLWYVLDPIMVDHFQSLTLIVHCGASWLVLYEAMPKVHHHLKWRWSIGGRSHYKVISLWPFHCCTVPNFGTWGSQRQLCIGTS